VCCHPCSERLGEVIGKTGLPWQNAFEVCVALDNGQAGASRAEEGINLGKPTAAALAALTGGSQVSAPPAARPKGTAPVPVNRPPPPARAPPASKPPPPARAPPVAAKPPPPARAPPAARPFSTQRVGTPAMAEASATSSGPLSFGKQVGTAIPGGWSEGKEFTSGGSFAAGELVIVRRSDGSFKFGEIIKSSGGFFAGAYEVRLPPLLPRIPPGH
jgi:hypothetical protein